MFGFLKNIGVFILTLSLSFCFVFSDDNLQGTIFERPASSDLITRIAAGPSLISKKDRKILADVLGKLDEAHLAVLDKASVAVKNFSNIEQVIREKTDFLPDVVQLPERAIVFTLILQIDMLDLILKKKNREQAGLLKVKREKKKVLNEKQRIYGDYRDVYFALILDVLAVISELQGNLGATGHVDLSFPEKLKKKDVPKYIENMIQHLLDRARALKNLG